MDEEEVKIEAEDPEAAEGFEAKVAKMREDLSACRKDKQDYMDGWQRAKADYVNLLKRIGEDAKASESRGKIQAVETLLPAFDALERAKEHGEIPKGFLAIAKQMESAFASLGQDKVESAEQDDIITTILEKGWRVGDSIIRPAKVRVGHFN